MFAAELAGRIVDWCLPIGLALVLVGVALTVHDHFRGRPLGGKAGPSEHGALEDGAKLATALQGLAPSGRILIAGLVLVALAATAAGVDALN